MTAVAPVPLPLTDVPEPGAGPGEPVVVAGRAVGPVDPSALRARSGTAGLTVCDLRHVPDDERGEAVADVLREAAEWTDRARVSVLLVPDGAVLVAAADPDAVPEAELRGLLARVCGTAPEPGAPGNPDGAYPAAPPPAAPSLQAPGALPTDWPRTDALAGFAGTVPLRLSGELVAAARALAEEAAVDVRTVLLAGAHVWVSRLGAGPVTAVAVEGGGAPGVSLADVGADPGFREVLGQVGGVNAPGPAAVALTVRDAPLLPAALDGAPLAPVPPPRTRSRYELRITLEPAADGGLHGVLEYAPELFEPVSAERIAARYPRLLAAVTGAPDTAVSRIPLLTDAERRLVVDAWNRTGPVPEPEGCLHELIARQAAAAPDAPAAVCGAETLSYGELHARAVRLAGTLAAHGAGPGRIVGICAHRSVDTVVGILAVLTAGAAWVPLDPAYPVDRLTYLLTDSQAPVVLADPAAAGLLAEAPVTVLPLRPGDAPPPGGPLPRVTPDALCYVIYTSGSTGRPKGAANTHRGVLNTMRSLVGRLRLDTASRLLQTSSPNFDMSAFDVLATLLSGGCLVIPEQHEATDPARLLDLAHRADLTVWSSTPALFRGALDEAYATGRGLPPRLRTVALGGDRFPPEVPQMLADLAPGSRMFNFAGVTEASFTTTSHPVTVRDALRAAVPWGRPLPGQRMYVLDDRGQPVPPGVPGELYLGGACVGAGYWNRPGLTAERFLPDPFVTAPGARMYRTGDRVRHLPDGAVEFLGRLDHQVKVRGFRIETGEIEAVLVQHPRVRDAVVEARADQQDGDAGDRRLLAHLELTGEEPLSVEELRTFLASRLPDHMVPSVFLTHDRIPLTPGGKTDRAALAAVPVPTDRPHLDTPYVPPRDDVERTIVAEWERVLGVDGVGAHDEFASLGGHSLVATATMAVLSEELGVPLSAADLFQASTPARLAQRVRGLRG